MMKRLLSFVDHSGALGPQQYCYKTSFENTSASGQYSTTVTSPFTINLNQPADDLNNDPHATYNFQFPNTYDADQSRTLGYNLPYIDFFQTGSSSTQDPNQSINVNPPPGSSTGEHFLFNISNAEPITISSDEDK